MMENTVVIYTDGASRGNPGQGGWGVVIIYPQDNRIDEFGGAQNNATNNQMELMGAIAALERIQEVDLPIIIRSDSQYVIKGITEWIWGWKKKGWRNSSGKPVVNQNLWERLDSITTEIGRSRIRWEHVKGHSGDPGNERADTIATSYADGKPAV